MQDTPVAKASSKEEESLTEDQVSSWLTAKSIWAGTLACQLMLTVGVATARQGTFLNSFHDLQRLTEEEIVLFKWLWVT